MNKDLLCSLYSSSSSESSSSIKLSPSPSPSPSNNFHIAMFDEKTKPRDSYYTKTKSKSDLFPPGDGAAVATTIFRTHDSPQPDAVDEKEDEG